MSDTYNLLAMADIASMRDEIKTRTTAQMAIIGAALTAHGALIAAQAAQADHWLILAAPIIAGPLGLFWIDHHVVIGTLGRSIAFVKQGIVARSDSLTADEGDPVTYSENSKLELGESLLHPRWWVWFAPLFIFVLLPIMEIVWALASTPNKGWSFLAVLGLDTAASAWTFLLWCRWCWKSEGNFSNLRPPGKPTLPPRQPA